MNARNGVIYGAAWLMTAALSVLAIVWADRVGLTIRFGFDYASAKDLVVACAVVAILLLIARIPRLRRSTHVMRYREVAMAIVCIVSFVIYGHATSAIMYLGITLDAPLIQDTLVRFDQALGFDWLAWYHWVASIPLLKQVFHGAYQSPVFQLIVLLGAFVATRRLDDMAEMLALVTVSMPIVLLISTALPAESAYLHFHINDVGTASTVSDFLRLRLGQLRDIDLLHIQGLVSMPSFHTMMGVYLIYSARNVRGVFALACVLNIVMIASTLTEGGHYLADVVAGVALAIGVVASVRAMMRPSRLVRLAVPA